LRKEKDRNRDKQEKCKTETEGSRKGENRYKGRKRNIKRELDKER
jgi:hypothetical protein